MFKPLAWPRSCAFKVLSHIMHLQLLEEVETVAAGKPTLICLPMPRLKRDAVARKHCARSEDSEVLARRAFFASTL